MPDFDRLIEVYREGGRRSRCDHQAVDGRAGVGLQHALCRLQLPILSSAMLCEVGFRTVRPWDPSNRRHHDFKDKACKIMSVGEREIAISLNLEAVK